MSPESVVDIFRSGLWLSVLILIIIIMPALVVGLLVSIFQAATSINEQTLSFLPRLLATLAVLAFVGPWISKRLIEFTIEIYMAIPYVIG